MSEIDLKEEEQKPKTRDYTRWRESPYLVIKGFLMGSADIVPGVSGGTMALITGIYHRLIDAIKSVNGRLINRLLKFRLKEVFSILHWKFLVLLFSGMVTAVAFFTHVVPLQIYMFTHSEIVYGLFFGLILGSIFLLISEVALKKWKWKYALPLAAGALFGFWIVTLVPADTPETFLFVMLSGAISICAMILPGISGSYILLILRKYEYILTQVGKIGGSETLDGMINLIPFFIGAIVGLALFARLLSWFLKRYYTVTILVLVGFLVGSLYVIWPFQEREYYESVRAEVVLPVSDSLVQTLLERDGEPLLPRYQRIAEVIENRETGEIESVKIETVSIQLLSANPVIPERDGEMNIWGGSIGIVIGLLMIWFISFLRKT